MSASFDSRKIISFMPSTAFIGVRISCDICAKKFDLALLAASAVSDADFS